VLESSSDYGNMFLNVYIETLWASVALWYTFSSIV